MPVYRITDTATGEHWLVDEPTDWDAWMHYRAARRMRADGGAMPFDCRMRVTGAPAHHDYAVEQIDPDTGLVVEGTYLTAFRGVPTEGRD
jgi:hypothetical protein